MKGMTKLLFYLAAVWVENIWKMNVAGISTGKRGLSEEFWSLGVDTLYFGVKEYRMGLLRDSLQEFTVRHEELMKTFKGLYDDLGSLGVLTEVEYRDPTIHWHNEPEKWIISNLSRWILLS